VYPYIVFLAFFQAPQPPGVPLVESCFDPSRVIATVGTSDPVQVRSSMAGGENTCYHVTAVINGKPVDGYVLGASLKAVAEFEKERARPIAAPPAPATVIPAAAAATTGIPPAVAPQQLLPVFGNFSGRSLNGKPVSLSGTTGKLILVCFWSPQNTPSLREAILVTRLVGRFRQQGVNAVTVSLSGNRELMGESLDAVTVPTVFNGSEIGRSYGVSYDSLPRTYILNDRHEILASGLRGKELENRVRSLATGR
jgi:hypothetical protein